MSKVGQGQLHDADSPEKFPVILADELDGLQKITVQNLRLRIQPKLFCNAWKQYGDYPQVVLPDQRTELALGDLVSGEERYLVLMLEVLPLPLLPDGSLPASLGGEEPWKRRDAANARRTDIAENRKRLSFPRNPSAVVDLEFWRWIRF